MNEAGCRLCWRKATPGYGRSPKANCAIPWPSGKKWTPTRPPREKSRRAPAKRLSTCCPSPACATASRGAGRASGAWAALDWWPSPISRVDEWPRSQGLAPLGVQCANPNRVPSEILYGAILRRSVRCPDPYVQMRGHWIVRRLSPHCSRIELDALASNRGECRLLEAMEERRRTSTWEQKKSGKQF